MRVLGVDYGDQRIGLAVSDKLLYTAQPIGFYQTQNKTKDKRYFKDLVAQYEVTEIVVGLPLLMDGTSGSRAQKTQEFGRWLEKAVNVSVVFWDERLSTKQAERIFAEHRVNIMKRKKIKDQVSATIILSSYLESKRKIP